MKRLARVLLVSWIGFVSAGRGVARAADPAPPSPATEERWYVGEMATVYVASLGLIVGGSSIGGSGRPPVLAAGELGFAFGPPILHMVHENFSTAGVSFALRGLFIVTVVETAGSCITFEGPPPDSTTCRVGAVLAATELIAMPVVDFIFAHKTVEKRPPPLSFLVTPQMGLRSGGVSLTGRF